MLGAIIGDIVGSRYEWHNIKTKEFDFFGAHCHMTDDSYMSLAVANALLLRTDDDKDLSTKAVEEMQRIGRAHMNCGFGGRFKGWLASDNPQPYNSFGNGSAMRVSACGFAADSIEQAKQLSLAVTRVTHDHPEGIKGAEAVATAIFMARNGSDMTDIREYICDNYYKLDFSLDDIRDTYTFDVSCQGSVPQAFEAFFESTCFEDAIRNAISIGGDSDTIAAITGSIAEAYYGIPDAIREKALSYVIDESYRKIISEFESKYKTFLAIGKRSLSQFDWSDEKPLYKQTTDPTAIYEYRVECISDNSDGSADVAKIQQVLDQYSKLGWRLSQVLAKETGHKPILKASLNQTLLFFERAQK